MGKAAFYTLGCKVNQYETEAITELFERGGYEIVDFEESADVYVINTCTVTGLSARKSRQMIRRAKSLNPASKIVVAGCYAQTAAEEVMAIPEVSLVIGTRDRNRILDYLSQLDQGADRINAVGNIMAARDFEELKVESYKERTRAYLKIQEGCTQFCSYCIIPYARGPVRSRQPQEVISEMHRLADKGFREIVLTGIHLASYGRDIPGTTLLDIIREAHRVEGIERIRLGSVEPTMINEGFVQAARELPKLCPHYHLSLQSGCDATLKRMNRKYTTEEFRQVVRILRQGLPDVSLTTDVMVGFPGETEEEFETTFDFLDEISFMQMHVFKFSPRKGTPAASFPQQVDPEVKEQRSQRLIQMSDLKKREYNARFIGRVLPVLLEQEAAIDQRFMEGHTSNYIRVLVQADPASKGKSANVCLTTAVEDYLKGVLA